MFMVTENKFVRLFVQTLRINVCARRQRTLPLLSLDDDVQWLHAVLLHILIAMCRNTCMRISNNDMIYSAVILILAINSLKMKQNVDFLVLQWSSSWVLNWHQNSTDGNFKDLRFR